MHARVRRTRKALALVLLATGACGRPRSAAVAADSPRIAVPAPGHPISEAYPPLSLPTEAVRSAVYEQINRDRRRAGLPAVLWDEDAARVADAFCAAQVAERTRSHFLRDGVPPYARAGLAGVFGYQAENVASWSTTASVFSDSPLELALSAHRAMIKEKPPDDGHRRTILDPEATHVGVGWAMTGGRFQMAEEFSTCWLERLTLLSEARPPLLRASGTARSPMTLRFVTLAREPLPVPLTEAQADSRRTYRYPLPSLAYVPEGNKWQQVVGVTTQDRLRVGSDREFSFTFAPEQRGLFTFVFWFAKSGDDRPRPGGSATIRVES